MSRPTGFAELRGMRVGIFGYGLEGRAAERVVRPLASSLVLVDDVADDDASVFATSKGGYEKLLECDVVLKSPGIPRRRPDVTELEARGVTVTSALNLWLHEIDLNRVIAITGTKGKSTTTSLTTFMLRCLGESAQSLGNIGVPPYDVDVDTSQGWLVVEISSFQCVDIDLAPHTIVVTSLGADHLDWHGSLAQYHDDKLSLTRTLGEHDTLLADTPTLRASLADIGGRIHFVEPDDSDLASALHLIGTHSASNVALALATVAQVTQRDITSVREMVQAQSSNFVPLPGRLTLILDTHVNDAHIRFVDDGLATTTLPTIAALDVMRNESVSIILGGFDRGVDYAELVDALMARSKPTFVVAMGPAGTRITETLAQRSSVSWSVVDNMGDAVREAIDHLSGDGVVLLSPGAPSFDRYENWQQRSNDFARVVAEQTR